MRGRFLSTLATVVKKPNYLSKETIKAPQNVRLLQPGQEVIVQINSAMANIGYLVSVGDHEIQALLPLSEEKFVLKKNDRGIQYGDKIHCYVSKIEDGKVLVSPRPLIRDRIPLIKKNILDVLSSHGPNGCLPIGDKSSPEEISEYFPGVSKSDFKKAIGSLYQDNRITVSRNQISTISNSNPITPIGATIYISNIHPDTRSTQELRQMISEIFAVTPLILSPKFSLKVTNVKKSSSTIPATAQFENPSDFSYLQLRKIRLKPQLKGKLVINGQSVGTDSTHDRYQQRDGRIGFVDVVWNHQLLEQQSLQEEQIRELKKQIEMIAIQLLHKKLFRGKKIKASKEITSFEKY